MEVGLIASVVGNGVYGYALASGMPIGEWHVLGIMNYLATPVCLFGNGVCNMPDEFGRGPVDYANAQKMDGWGLSKNKDSSLEMQVFSGKPGRKVSNFEVGLRQGRVGFTINTLAFAVGAGAGLLAKEFN